MASRVAKNPVAVPKGVEVRLVDQDITIKGKNGELNRSVHPLVKVSYQDDAIRLSPVNDEIEANALAGTMRALINNMVIGVCDGFQRELKLVGVGYRAKVQGDVVNLTVGFSHPVNFKLPAGVSAETPSATDIILKGADKQKVSQIAANIRAVRPPEPYKGKGIRYSDETIIRKEGKKK